MSHSLRSKIKCLRYKGIITDKDCDRLRNALDNDDVLDKIRAEIEKKYERAKYMRSVLQMNAYIDCLQIIDKYKVEGEEI